MSFCDPVASQADGESPDTVAAIQRVRDATRLFLTPSADERGPSPRVRAAEVLHGEARRAAGHLALDFNLDDGAPRWRHKGGEQDVFVSATASRCILFLGGDDADRVRPRPLRLPDALRSAAPRAPLLRGSRAHTACANGRRRGQPPGRRTRDVLLRGELARAARGPWRLHDSGMISRSGNQYPAA